MLNITLQKQLLAMQRRDLEMREELVNSGELFSHGYHPKMKRIHEENNIAMAEMLEQFGWPGFDLVGTKGCEAAWLIVQHAVIDRALQEFALKLLKKAVLVQQADQYMVAYLEDRLLMTAHKPQVYGTQHIVDEQLNQLVPYQIAHTEQVNELRAQAGLPPLSLKTAALNNERNKSLNINKLQRIEVTVSQVAAMLSKQFPQWQHLELRPLHPQGWDNRTFCLGEKYLIRLPSAKEYTAQVHTEQKWLPRLQSQLPLSIPTVIALGEPCAEYPWHWSVYQWLPGKSANLAEVDNLKAFAISLGQWLARLQSLAVRGGPLPGPRNFYRGGVLAIYDQETRGAIKQHSNHINANKALDIWEAAIATTQQTKPLWVHGDFSADNLLVVNGKLASVIDFGCMAIGDPACDLTIYWTFLPKLARDYFKSEIHLPEEYWQRAKGWALWKALITIENNTSKKVLQRLGVLL